MQQSDNPDRLGMDSTEGELTMKDLDQMITEAQPLKEEHSYLNINTNHQTGGDFLQLQMLATLQQLQQ
jgi:hypothetical protein